MQKCSGHKPSCVRCRQSGWNCVYAPRARRKVVPRKTSAEPTEVTRARKEKNGSNAVSSGSDFLPERRDFLPGRREEPEAGPSRLQDSPIKRPHKRRKGGDAGELDVTYSYSESPHTGHDKGLAKARGEGGNGFVRRDAQGKELLMTAREYVSDSRC